MRTTHLIILTMAADHGVAEDGVSAFPQEVTVQMAQNILLGGAGVNVLGRAAGAEVRLTDMGIKEDISGLPGAENLNIVKIAPGSENMHTGPAMTREQAVAALEAGINIANQAVADGAQLLGTGDLGIGKDLAILPDGFGASLLGKNEGKRMPEHLLRRIPVQLEVRGVGVDHDPVGVGEGHGIGRDLPDSAKASVRRVHRTGCVRRLRDVHRQAMDPLNVTARTEDRRHAEVERPRALRNRQLDHFSGGLTGGQDAAFHRLQLRRIGSWQQIDVGFAHHVERVEARAGVVDPGVLQMPILLERCDE